MNLKSIEYNLYAKQIILENIGINGQQKLKNAKILIVGLGGLGCPALLYLVTSGIGSIGIIDHDQIDISNLNRQILYNINDISKYKTISAKLAIKKINQQCNIKAYNEKLDPANAKSIIKRYDIILDATDNFKTRYNIDQICYTLHKIHIYGAINKYEGHIGVFNYKNNLRYKDIYPKNLNLKNINCEDNGIIGTMSGIIGILQATESIKIILGIGKIINGYLLKYNLLETSFQYIKLNPTKDLNNYAEMQKQKDNINNFINTTDLIKKHQSKYIVIDIRNRHDFKISHAYKAINIPVKYFKAKKTIEFIKYYCYQYQIIISCNQFIKSSTISKLLASYQINTYILNK